MPVIKESLAVAVVAAETDLIDHVKVKELPLGGFFKVKNTGAEPLTHRVYHSHGGLNEVKPSTPTLDTNQTEVDTQIVNAGDTYTFQLGTDDHYDFLKSTVQRIGADSTANGWLDKPGNKGA